MTDSTVITRFNPTANGPMHIGHLYSALVNRDMARTTPGGKFLLRIEDDQTVYEDKISEKTLKEYRDNIIIDFAWAGIIPDAISYNSERGKQLTLKKLIPRSLLEIFPQQARRSQFFPLTPGNDILFLSYTPEYTLNKVIFDYLDNVTYLIRGIDLISEFSLYCFYCNIMNLPIPEHYYIPRLRIDEGGDINMVSKSKGGHSLAELRELGVDPSDLIHSLAESCLIDPSRGWLLDNLKGEVIHKNPESWGLDY